VRARRVYRVAAGLAVASAATLAYAWLVERNLFTLRRFDVPMLPPDTQRGDAVVRLNPAIPTRSEAIFDR
jgi:hypothetical protein